MSTLAAVRSEDWVETHDHVPNVNPTFYLNHVFTTNPNRWDRLSTPGSKYTERPLLLHRRALRACLRQPVGSACD
jgi:hypothetical protein